ncbi:MAG: tetratricopeptide repeat protein [Gemmatimonadota bacterium]
MRHMRVSGHHLIDQARERFALQDYYGAIHLLEEVKQAGRPFADVEHLLGLSQALLGRPELALGHFEEALRLNPRYIEAHIHRGLMLTELGRTEEGEEAFRLASVCNMPVEGGLPPHIVAQLANRHAELAEAYAEVGHLAEAIEQYRRATELAPTFADLRYRMARLMLEEGRTLAAREELEKVVADRPNFVDAIAALGLAHYLSGDAAGAGALWKDCLSDRPSNARIEAYLGMLERAES